MQNENPPQIPNHPLIGLGGKGVRIIITVAAIAMIFSGLKAYTGKMRAEAQIHYIEVHFEQKDRKTMLAALSSCEGDLSDQNVVTSCINNYKTAILAPHKTELNKMRVYGFLWWLFWGGLGVLVYTKVKAKNSISLVNILKTVFDRTVIHKVKKLLGI